MARSSEKANCICRADFASWEWSPRLIGVLDRLNKCWGANSSICLGNGFEIHECGRLQNGKILRTVLSECTSRGIQYNDARTVPASFGLLQKEYSHPEAQLLQGSNTEPSLGGCMCFSETKLFRPDQGRHDLGGGGHGLLWNRPGDRSGGTNGQLDAKFGLATRLA